MSYDNPQDSSVAQTSHRHSEAKNIDVAEVIREHEKILRRKLELIIEGRLKEARTSKMEFRTWPELKYVYGKAPDHVKTAARRAFEAVIISWFLGMRETQALEYAGSPVIINLNLNMNEAKADARASVDLTPIKDILEKLYELRKPLPPVQRKLIEELYGRLSKLN